MQHTMILYLYIAIGGATGACLRYFCTTSIDSLFGKALPFGTLTVNVVGSFCLAMLYSLIERGDVASIPYKGLIGVGLLGAFTTFSTFSVETLTLIQNGLWFKALANILLNVVVCLLAAWLAIEISKG